MIFPATGSSQILRRPASTDRPYRRLENWTAGLLTLAARCFVPQADDDFPDLPARYPTLNVPFDVCGALAHLAS